MGEVCEKDMSDTVRERLESLRVFSDNPRQLSECNRVLGELHAIVKSMQPSQEPRGQTSEWSECYEAVLNMTRLTRFQVREV